MWGKIPCRKSSLGYIFDSSDELKLCNLGNNKKNQIGAIVKKLKNKLRRFANLLRYEYSFHREGFLDLKRYRTFSYVKTAKNFQNIEAEIIRTYHVIEKGLGMPEFRFGFGKESVKHLFETLGIAFERFPESYKGNQQVKAAHCVLHSYFNVHRHQSQEKYLKDLPSLSVLEDVGEVESEGGVSFLKELALEEREILGDLIMTRRSARNFEVTRIPEISTIERAVQVAQSAPSVCNRQSGRVHCYFGKDVTTILECQNGNRGFGQTVPCVLVVTSDLKTFRGIIERNQAWIDGGMFAMNLLLGLHSVGLGAVALNWSVKNVQDEQLRVIGNVPEHERVIMMIACGYSSSNAVSPVSWRRNLCDVLQIHSA